ncbi:MAG: Sir2 family NAD+-dependent deacetylase [Alphaproteobacteria bacterium]
MTQHTIVVLTGAGISAESGLATFRAQDGLWEQHRIEDVATPEGFARNPALVHQFYNLRRQQLKTAQPNAAHIALGRLYKEWPGRVVLITQNIDDLHERAMPPDVVRPQNRLLHMHGELNKSRCYASEQVFDCTDDLSERSVCGCCNMNGTLRPHIVWFGEMPFYMDEIYQALDTCDLFLSIGTSGTVYPAAGFVQEVQRRGHGRGHTVELNLEPSSGQSLFDEHIYGPATQVVPEYINNILKNIN